MWGSKKNTTPEAIQTYPFPANTDITVRVYRHFPDLVGGSVYLGTLTVRFDSNQMQQSVFLERLKRLAKLAPNGGFEVLSGAYTSPGLVMTATELNILELTDKNITVLAKY